jgi:hypothetical protein
MVSQEKGQADSFNGKKKTFNSYPIQKLSDSQKSILSFEQNNSKD